MGTSGAYSGSKGWSDIPNDTQDWLDNRPSGPGEGEGSAADEEIPVDEEPAPEEQVPAEEAPEETPGVMDPAIAKILHGVTSRLAEAVGSTSGTTSGSGGRGGTSRGGSGGGRRSSSATSGGAAIAGAYGVTSRSSDALEDVGLTLDELEGLSPFEQAQKLVSAASETSATIAEQEIREINAKFILQVLDEDESPSPEQLVKAWVTEFVYRVWLTEAGPVLRDGTRDGARTRSLEQEVRVTLEAAVSGMDLPTNGLRAADFQRAVQNLLGKLARIFREVAA